MAEPTSPDPVGSEKPLTDDEREAMRAAILHAVDHPGEQSYGEWMFAAGLAFARVHQRAEEGEGPERHELDAAKAEVSRRPPRGVVFSGAQAEWIARGALAAAREASQRAGEPATDEVERAAKEMRLLIERPAAEGEGK